MHQSTLTEKVDCSKCKAQCNSYFLFIFFRRYHLSWSKVLIYQTHGMINSGVGKITAMTVAVKREKSKGKDCVKNSSFSGYNIQNFEYKFLFPLFFPRWTSRTSSRFFKNRRYKRKNRNSYQSLARVLNPAAIYFHSIGQIFFTFFLYSYEDVRASRRRRRLFDRNFSVIECDEDLSTTLSYIYATELTLLFCVSKVYVYTIYVRAYVH